ncbi:ABC transporter ATP-binding protein [Rivibacter subsaxonicus]|uniref:NitT/TauT family transport system ATP-binding protein n=1 Tax=Rivibacter subsaxonicus TaxID=457575 RepID=A0A4Q7VXM5_9BURK|nr:ABC transporter ATP-binding protein [Rivibacter subsaxonicus]RZU01139.1 NitT/TauT family transport system ATP-binding protein [Rivibacter subsaxonicus]
MTPPLLALHQVDKRFAGGTLALQGLDLAIARGSFTSLLGSSGCGKSTLLRLLAGLETPTAGRVERADDAVGNTGFVFQQPTLMPWARVAANVALPLQLQRRRQAEIDTAVAPALAAVGLQDFGNAFPRELSGGMQMRASIARALITRPALLLLDEPFAALDEITRFRLNEDLLALWQRDAFTAVFVTHSVAEAVFLSQRIVVMAPRPGRVSEIIGLDAPYPRHAAFRATPAFAEACIRVSQALLRASDG